MNLGAPYAGCACGVFDFRLSRSTLQNRHPTPKSDRSIDIASVIVTFMVTCRVLPRFILDSCSGQRFPVAQLCFLVNPLETTLPRFSASVHSKRLTPTLSPLECALTKNQGALPSPQFQFSSRLSRALFGEGPPAQFIASLLRCFVTSLFVSRWSPVVFQWEMLPISSPLISLPGSSHQNGGGCTPLPPNLLTSAGLSRARSRGDSLLYAVHDFRCLVSFTPGDQP
jgi:hypothetical protein